ncbi:hypothetical protein KSX_14720 [Ktedonospora formicarum]|uniref:Uncharacterized protein n=2 Tax=Ktedonospora formicarum TaxID=2778364 RepID=A0A8J3I0I6_9CHLR|nr:hypothetical protein KSX_14720 [Ktedonospora formicarum]
MTHVTLTCTTEALCQEAHSMRLNAGLSAYLPSDTFVKGKTVDIYYRATVFEGNGRWYLIPPASSKQSYIFLART